MFRVYLACPQKILFHPCILYIKAQCSISIYQYYQTHSADAYIIKQILFHREITEYKYPFDSLKSHYKQSFDNDQLLSEIFER